MTLAYYAIRTGSKIRVQLVGGDPGYVQSLRAKHNKHGKVPVIYGPFEAGNEDLALAQAKRYLNSFNK